ncbi:MAG: CHAT domain-containing protein, partial [Caldilinea sp.]
MAHCRFTDFDITIHGHHAPYLVHAAYRQHTATGQLDDDATQPEWAARLDHLAMARGLVGQHDLEEIGTLLYERLFRDDVRELWVHARTDLDNGDAGICIRLRIQPPAVAALPWEAMFDPDRNLALAGSLQTPLVRVETLLRHVGQMRPLTASLPLRLLTALPDDPTDQIDGEIEMQRLFTALGPLGEKVIEIATLRGRFSVVELRQTIARERPDIVHLVTHGQPDGVLLWQHDTPVLTPATALRTAFEGADSVKLVVLNACSTAHGSLSRSLASVGAQLLQTGMPAVIAMQFDIEEGVAGDFAQYFYQELFGGQCPGVVHRAVNFARSNLFALNPDSIGYATPILWLNAPDGAIFDGVHPPLNRPSRQTEHTFTEQDFVP